MSSFAPPARAKDGGIEAPMSLGGLFADSSDSDEEGAPFDQQYSEQTVHLAEESLTIRQYCWHMANANKVWPGTFTLAEFLAAHRERYSDGGDMLELGAATGALSIYLCSIFPHLRLCTSDIDDGGDVQANIQYNFERNGLAGVPHVAHTWGSAWEEDAQHLSPPNQYRFKYIVASDILLYVSAYPALVKTLKTLFLLGNDTTGKRPKVGSISPEQISANIMRLFGTDATANKKWANPPVPRVDDDPEDETSTSVPDAPPALGNVTTITATDLADLFQVEFLMSWQRRIAQSEIFFSLMRDEGFHIHHHGKCVYSFFLLYDTSA